jgi:hypothetical protein
MTPPLLLLWPTGQVLADAAPSPVHLHRQPWLVTPRWQWVRSDAELGTVACKRDGRPLTGLGRECSLEDWLLPIIKGSKNMNEEGRCVASSAAAARPCSLGFSPFLACIA